MFARELTARGRLSRASPPSSALGGNQIRAGMEDGGAVDGRTAAGYLYHSARISQTIAGAKYCVDAGCGTGVQLLQVATLNPDIRFIGIDSDRAMLDVADGNAKRLGLTNVEWLNHDLTTPWPATHAIDAVISTMTLHDLRDASALKLFAQHLGATTPGAIYIEDFARLCTKRSIEFFVNLNAPVPRDAFSRLYECSLSAAFTLDELRTASALLPNARLYSTFLAPFLVVIKTPDRDLSAPLRQQLRQMRNALRPAYRRDLDDLRRFFAFGGLGNDPFA